MAGSRGFDDERWADQEGFAACFLCGRKVDPRDPQRGTYTPNAQACEPMVAHIPCLQEAVKDPVRLRVIAMTAINQMGQEAMKRFREEARCVAPSPVPR